MQQFITQIASILVSFVSPDISELLANTVPSCTTGRPPIISLPVIHFLQKSIQLFQDLNVKNSLNLSLAQFFSLGALKGADWNLQKLFTTTLLKGQCCIQYLHFVITVPRSSFSSSFQDYQQFSAVLPISAFVVFQHCVLLIEVCGRRALSTILCTSQK